MTGHTASCRCGQLKAIVTREPVRVSVCHCLDCQKRTGSAFSMNMPVLREGFVLIAGPKAQPWLEAARETDWAAVPVNASAGT